MLAKNAHTIKIANHLAAVSWSFHGSVIVVHNTTPILVRLAHAILLTQLVLLRPALWIEVRSFSTHSYPDCMSTMRRETVGGGVVLAVCQHVSDSKKRSTYRDSVIPKGYITLVPLESGMNLWTRCHNLSQETDNVIGLRLRYADNLCYEAWVEEDALPACHGICPNEGVFGGDGLTTHCPAEVA
jgi:hypothetical protein